MARVDIKIRLQKTVVTKTLLHLHNTRIHSQHPIGMLLHDINIVAYYHHGTIGIEVTQQSVHIFLEMAVHVSVRLVKYKHIRLGNDSACKQHTLQLSSTECADMSVCEVDKVETLQCRFHHVLMTRCKMGEKTLLGAQSRKHNLTHRDRKHAVDIAVLRQITHRHGIDSRAITKILHSPTVWLLQAKHHLHQRSLATTVRSNNADEVTFANVKRHILKHSMSLIRSAYAR